MFWDDYESMKTIIIEDIISKNVKIRMNIFQEVVISCFLNDIFDSIPCERHMMCNKLVFQSSCPDLILSD